MINMNVGELRNVVISLLERLDTPEGKTLADRDGAHRMFTNMLDDMKQVPSDAAVDPNWVQKARFIELSLNEKQTRVRKGSFGRP